MYSSWSYTELKFPSTQPVQKSDYKTDVANSSISHFIQMKLVFGYPANWTHHCKELQLLFVKQYIYYCIYSYRTAKMSRFSLFWYHLYLRAILTQNSNTDAGYVSHWKSSESKKVRTKTTSQIFTDQTVAKRPT